MRNSISVAVQAGILGFTLICGQALVAQQAGNASDMGHIQREVRHELTMLPFYSVFDNLEYSVNGNVVTLAGQVTKPVLKSDAEKAVKGIEGVTNVVNNIEVLPLSPSDDNIRRAVYFKLFAEGSTLFKYGWSAVPPIHIIVKNGRLTLVGVVDTDADKNAAELFAKQVPGVLSVTNDLQVKKG